MNPLSDILRNQGSETKMAAGSSSTGDGRSLPSVAPDRARNKGNVCSVSWCENPAHTRGWCKGHYKRWLMGGDMDAPFKHKNKGFPCSFPDCGSPANVRGLCNGHAEQVKRGLELRPLKRKRPGTWSPWHVGESGYSRRSRVNPATGKREHQQEHRLVMEQQLGRPLLPDETVHHINGVRDDNRPENLELWSSSHPKGQRVEDKVEWAKMILARYENTDQT